MDRILSIIIRIIVAFARLGVDRRDKWYPGRKIKILLAGYNGARNTGSDARVSAIAKQIKEVFGEGNVEITVMALDKENLAGYFDEDVTLRKFTTIYPFNLYKACCENHVAVLCEGSTLKSTFANGLTLFLCEAAGVMAAQGKPCIAYGADVGQMEPFLAKTAQILCRNTYFITRTDASLERLKKLGLHGHAGTDTAWIYDRVMKEEEVEDLLRSKGWDGASPIMGIAPIDPFCWPVRASITKWAAGTSKGRYDKWYYFSDSPARRQAYRKYIGDIAEASKHHLEQKGYFPVILGMERLDRQACEDLEELLGMKAAVFTADEYPAQIMTGILRKLSMLVTSRYHAAVLSMETPCPVVAISMDERLDGIMGELDFDEYLHHVDDENLADELKDSMDRAEAGREEIEEHLKQQVVSYKEKLAGMGDFLHSFITGRL